MVCIRMACLFAYDASVDSWSRHAAFSGGWMQYYMTSTIDTNRHAMLAVGAGFVHLWDLDNPDEPPQEPATSGEQIMVNAPSPGLAYVTVTDQYIAWHGGATEYTLDPDRWSWNAVSPAAVNTVTPGAVATAPTYGRFRYVPSKNVFIAVNATNENVYFCQLSDRGAVTLPEPGQSSTSISSGETVNLSWSAR